MTGKLSYLLLGQVVGQVSNHDLGLGGNAIGRGATLTALAGLTGSASLFLGSLVCRVSCVLVGNVFKWLNLSGGLCVSSRGGGNSLSSSSLAFLLVLTLL